MTIKNNLNLRLQDLRVFDAILSNGSITMAAEVLEITQSSVSKQLKSLRQTFGDELFVRSGRGMAATNKALALAPQIANLIASIEALHGEVEFDPVVIERNFVIAATDEVQHFLLPQLVNRIASDSPRSRVTFKVLERDYAAKQLESGGVDLAIAMNWHIPDHLKQQRLYDDEFVVLYRKDHPLQDKRLTLHRYLAATHMMVSPLGNIYGPVDEVLHADGHKRFVSLAVPYFMSVADALLNSDLIVTLQRRACDDLVRNHALRIDDLPVKMRRLNYFMFWHKRYDQDSTNQWLRQVCYDILHTPKR